MHVDWHVYWFIVNFTILLQPFNNSEAARNCKPPLPSPSRSSFTKGPIYAGRFVCIEIYIYIYVESPKWLLQSGFDGISQKTRSCSVPKVICTSQDCPRLTDPHWIFLKAGWAMHIVSRLFVLLEKCMKRHLSTILVSGSEKKKHNSKPTKTQTIHTHCCTGWCRRAFSFEGHSRTGFLAWDLKEIHSIYFLMQSSLKQSIPLPWYLSSAFKKNKILVHFPPRMKHCFIES